MDTGLKTTDSLCSFQYSEQYGYLHQQHGQPPAEKGPLLRLYGFAQVQYHWGC